MFDTAATANYFRISNRYCFRVEVIGYILIASHEHCMKNFLANFQFDKKKKSEIRRITYLLFIFKSTTSKG